MKRRDPLPDPREVGPRLQRARQTARLPLNDVARMMMIEHRVLVRCERGEILPAPHQVEALARIYGTSVAWLMRGDTNAPASTPTPITPLFPPAPASAEDAAARETSAS
jgi:ribosome-binding protein aMBF1 (putative translation factor)